jgi:hypothetical protein
MPIFRNVDLGRDFSNYYFWTLLLSASAPAINTLAAMAGINISTSLSLLIVLFHTYWFAKIRGVEKLDRITRAKALSLGIMSSAVLAGLAAQHQKLLALDPNNLRAAFMTSFAFLGLGALMGMFAVIGLAWMLRR